MSISLRLKTPGTLPGSLAQVLAAHCTKVRVRPAAAVFPLVLSREFMPYIYP